MIGTCAAHISCNLMVTQQIGRIIIELPLPGKCRSILNFRMIFLPHTNTVILLEPYCGTITEPGLPVASHYPVAKRTTKDARGNIVGTTEEWLSRDDITVALYLRSTQYYVLLQQYTRPVNHYP